MSVAALTAYDAKIAYGRALRKIGVSERLDPECTFMWHGCASRLVAATLLHSTPPTQRTLRRSR